MNDSRSVLNGTASARASIVSEPAWLRRGPLFCGGGVAVFGDLVDARTFGLLSAEAQANYPSSDRQVCNRFAGDDGRGGYPARCLTSAGGGPVQDAVYASRHLHDFLGLLCGGPVRPSGTRGSYSYYVEPGDFLDLHLDIVTCDVTVISVLTDTSPRDGGALAIRRDSVGARLSSLRATCHANEEVIKTSAGRHVVILGGLVPHRVLPLVAGGQRVISALCFEAVST